MNKKSVSIVIPNYNGRHLLEEFLPFTIQAIKNAAVDYEIIVVDDASKDDSIAFVEAHYPEIILLKNNINKGFSATCNKGIMQASKELMLILNSDIQLSPNYFDNQWQCFEDENTFGVMGRIIDTGSNTHDGPRLPQRFGFKFKQNKIYETADQNHPAPTIFLSGANALVCSKKIKQILGFDEIFSPFYFEDVDLSLRAWRLGWQCYYAFASTCYHIGSSTINANNLKKSVKATYYRNRYILHGIHLNKTQYTWFKVQTFIFEVLPKVLMGQIWVWKSYSALSAYQEKIASSKLRLEKQSENTGTKLSLFSLSTRINAILKDGNYKVS